VTGLVNVELCCSSEGQCKVIISVMESTPDAMWETPQQLVENLQCFLLHELAPISEIQQNVPDRRMELFN